MALTSTGSSNRYVEDTTSSESLDMRGITVLAWTRADEQVYSTQNRVWVLSDDVTIATMPNILSVACNNAETIQVQLKDGTTSQIWATSTIDKTEMEPIILRVRLSSDAFDLRQGQTDLYTNQSVTPSMSGKTVDQLGVGGRSGQSSQDYTGNTGFVAIWQEWLSDDDTQALSDGAHPLMISPATLKVLMPMDKVDDMDLMQAFTNFTSPDSPPSIDPALNPPLLYPE